MDLSDFDYDLPPELIAQHPLQERDASRMLCVSRSDNMLKDEMFSDLTALVRGDELVVVNNTRVLPARLFGRRAGVHSSPPGAHSRASLEFLSSRIEVLLVRRIEGNLWEALVRPGRKLRVGERIVFDGGELVGEIVERGDYGIRRLLLSGSSDPAAMIERIGHVPLPPYIRRSDETADRERYQTVFASQPGAVAAPTAGLHFTPSVIARLRERGVQFCELTLEVGLGTFQPIHENDLDMHRMHTESYDIPEATAEAVSAARSEGKPILAIGTTVVRALEDAALKSASDGGSGLEIKAGRSSADIFIRPGHRFRIVDQLLTNFHLPKSTLLVLVAAFAGRELTLAAFRHAVATRYRFYSYGDCMLIR